MLSCNLIGNLTQDPAQRQTPSGAQLVAIDVACTMGKNKPPVYVSCTAWDEPLMSNLLKYLHKGSKVAVTGNLDYPHSYITKSGEPKAVVKVKITACEFLANGKPEEEKQMPQNIPGMPQNNYSNNGGYQRQQGQANIQPVPQGFSEVDPSDDDSGFFNPYGQLPY